MCCGRAEPGGCICRQRRWRREPGAWTRVARFCVGVRRRPDHRPCGVRQLQRLRRPGIPESGRISAAHVATFQYGDWCGAELHRAGRKRSVARHRHHVEPCAWRKRGYLRGGFPRPGQLPDDVQRDDRRRRRRDLEQLGLLRRSDHAGRCAEPRRDPAERTGIGNHGVDRCGRQRKYMPGWRAEHDRGAGGFAEHHRRRRHDGTARTGWYLRQRNLVGRLATHTAERAGWLWQQPFFCAACLSERIERASAALDSGRERAGRSRAGRADLPGRWWRLPEQLPVRWHQHRRADLGIGRCGSESARRKQSGFSQSADISTCQRQRISFCGVDGQRFRARWIGFAEFQ